MNQQKVEIKEIVQKEKEAISLLTFTKTLFSPPRIPIKESSFNICNILFCIQRPKYLISGSY